MYLDNDNIPFYIGKGKGDRYLISKHLRGSHPHLNNKIRKLGITNIQIQFLHKHLSEADALKQETYWIRHIGRKDQGSGSLCNLTDGGETVKFTEETRRKIGRANKGRSPWIQGKHHSAETRKKIGQRPYIFSAATRAKMSLAKKKFGDAQEEKIICLYVENCNTLKEIAVVLGCSKGGIKSCLLRHDVKLRRKGPRSEGIK